MKKALVALSLLGLAVFFLLGQWPVSPSAVTGEALPQLSADNPKAYQPAQPISPEPTAVEQAPLQQQLQWLASAYASDIQIPPYSRPLTTADTQLLSPNRFIPQPVPLQQGASASLYPSQYRFLYPEPIELILRLQGINTAQAHVRLVHEWSGEVLTEQQMQATSDGFYLQLASQPDWDGAVTAEVRLMPGGESLVLRTGFEVRAPVATITATGSSYADGADMVIPLELQVKLDGHYRLRANLFDEQRQPIAVLSTRQQLSAGTQTLALRAHRSVLPKTETAFWLTTFQLERLSPSPSEPTRYGNAAEAEFALEPFPLHQLSKTPYRPSEQEQQRLRLLQQMAH